MADTRRWTEEDWERLFSTVDEERSRFEAILSANLSAGMKMREAWSHAAREMGWPDCVPEDPTGCLSCPDLSACGTEGDFPRASELPEPPETIGAWRLAHQLAESVEELAEPYYELHLDTDPLRRIHAACVNAASNLAAGHRLGYTSDVVLGNIARCRRARACMDEFMRRLDEVKRERTVPERVHRRIAIRARIVREAIDRRIASLRQLVS